MLVAIMRGVQMITTLNWDGSILLCQANTPRSRDIVHTQDSATRVVSDFKQNILRNTANRIRRYFPTPINGHIRTGGHMSSGGILNLAIMLPPARGKST